MEPNLDWYDVIDDFLPVMGAVDTVLIPRARAGSDLHVDVAAAIAAAAGGLKSLDWARSYVDRERIQTAAPQFGDLDLLRRSYDISLEAIREARSQLEPAASGTTLGEFASSIALERWPTTLKSVHLLYMVGHQGDGDVVARAALEQLAWALAAGSAATTEDLEEITSSNEIGNLKGLYPTAGRLYGQLSRSAHMAVIEHLGPVRESPAGTAIISRQDTLEWGSLVLLRLCDAWLSVWEATQRAHLRTLQHVEAADGALRLRDERAFAQRAREHMACVRAHRDNSD